MGESLKINFYGSIFNVINLDITKSLEIIIVIETAEATTQAKFLRWGLLALIIFDKIAPIISNKTTSYK